MRLQRVESDRLMWTWKEEELSLASKWSWKVVQFLLIESLLVQIWRSQSSAANVDTYSTALNTVCGMVAASLLAYSNCSRTQRNVFEAATKYAVKTCQQAFQAGHTTALRFLQRMASSGSHNLHPKSCVHCVRHCFSRLRRLVPSFVNGCLELLWLFFVKLARYLTRRPGPRSRDECSGSDNMELTTSGSSFVSDYAHPFESDPFLELDQDRSSSTWSETESEPFRKLPPVRSHPMDRGEVTSLAVAAQQSSSSKWL
jgi:hypothetical protein